MNEIIGLVILVGAIAIVCSEIKIRRALREKREGSDEQR